MQTLSTEDKIVEAARVVFLKKGYAGARMQDIADEAGINKALLHYYFRNKERLFEVIFKEALGKLLPIVNDIVRSDQLGFYKKLEAFIHAYISMAIENPFIPLFILNEMQSNQEHFLKHVFTDYKKLPFKKFAATIQEAVDEKLIQPVEPLQLLMHILSLCLFPFLARPMFQKVMHISDPRYQKMMEARKAEVTAFVIRSLKKK